MDLEPGKRRAAGDDLPDVGRAQANPSSRHALAGNHDARALRSASGLQTAAHQALTRAGGHVDPGVLLIVPPRRARAGGVGRLAIVLPRLGDAVALFGLELRFRSRAAALSLS